MSSIKQVWTENVDRIQLHSHTHIYPYETVCEVVFYTYERVGFFFFFLVEEPEIKGVFGIGCPYNYS